MTFLREFVFALQRLVINNKCFTETKTALKTLYSCFQSTEDASVMCANRYSRIHCNNSVTKQHRALFLSLTTYIFVSPVMRERPLATPTSAATPCVTP